MVDDSEQFMRSTYTSAMNQFTIFAHGVDFSPESFLASTRLNFDKVWHKGEFSDDHPKSSGVEIILGNGQELTLFDQESIAIEFLSTNRVALKELAEYPGVTTFILGLQYNLALEPSTLGFSMGPSAALMWHALDVGIEPTFYVILK